MPKIDDIDLLAEAFVQVNEIAQQERIPKREQLLHLA